MKRIRLEATMKATSKRGGVCPVCGEVVYEGVKLQTPQNYYYIHGKCYTFADKWVEYVTPVTDSKSNRCIAHTLEVNTSRVEVAMYLMKNGFTKVRRVNPISYCYRSELMTNNQKLGKMIEPLLNEGSKVFVNGKLVTSLSEYRELTDRLA